MDDTGIELEDFVSTKELEVLTLPFTLAEKGKDVYITGVALTEGVWKNVIYSAAEIKKVAKQLIGKPLLIEHGNTREFGAKQVGKVINSYYESILKGIVFEAKITDSLAKKLVKKEILPAVSCSTWMDKRPVNETIRVGSGYIFAELSLVRVPACDRCFIFHKEQLSLLSSREGKDLKVIKEKRLFREEIPMETEEMETLSEIEREEEELSEFEELEAPKLYAVLELPDEDSLSSLRESQNVVSYYYGFAHLNPLAKPKYDKYYKKDKEEKVLLATVELASKDDLVELKLTYKIRDAFYANLREARPPRMFQSLSGSDSQEILALLKRMVGEGYPPVKPFVPKKLKNIEPAPNPESCAKVTCPIDDQEFKDEEKFLEHWNKEHKEKYGKFKETMTLLEALAKIVDLAKGDTKITKMKTGRFVVFKDTGKTGFGQWKIIGNFATLKEAKAAAGKAKEEKAEYYKEKDKYGCVVGKEEWDKEKEKCVPVSKEEQSAYTDHIKKCMKAGKSMKECAKTWKKEEKSAYTDFIKKCMADKKEDVPDVKARIKACAAEWKKKGYKKPEEEPEEKQEVACPACKKKFEDEKALAEHWKEVHKEKYGPLKKGYKYPEKKGKARLTYYYYKYRGKYYPYYYRKGKYYKKYKKKYKKKKKYY